MREEEQAFRCGQVPGAYGAAHGRTRISLIVVLLVVLWAEAVPAADGRLIEHAHDVHLTPPQIESSIARLFSGYPPPSAHYSVDIYLIRYQSLYPDDAAAAITAQLFVPRSDVPIERPLYVFAPGTTGLIDACRPSREHSAGIHWGLYREHMLAFAAAGIIGLLPDYTGFGDPDRIQPLFHVRSEGRMMLDGVRAAHEFFARHNSALQPAQGAFLAGFSQGGHAAFAAADLRQSYAPEVAVAGVIGYGATTDLQTVFREFPVVAPMIVHVFSELYGTQRFDPRQILQDRWLAHLEHHVTRQCIGAMQSYYPWNARAMFRPEFYDALTESRLRQQFPAIHRILERNSSGLSGHGIPALILQGSHDIVISARSQELFVQQLKAAGSHVDYRLYEDTRHDTRQAAFPEVLAWIESHSEHAPGEAQAPGSPR
ncbi:MAG: hypothetical protein EA384_16160 [Spirochaetaceae bacterium]|nr:MAG: hypothetical protein EA384_16160 [Spirochaetaceae bacterium]